MKAIICGDRNWDNFSLIEDVVKTLGITFIVNGACRGADKLSTQVALKYGIGFKEYPADWEHEGKAAGPIRNQEMLYCEIGGLDITIGFHNNLEKSKGTKHMMQISKDAEIVTLLVTE